MILRLALLSALCVFSGFCEEQESKLLGKWRSVTTSKGGIGALLDFRQGGKFEYIPAAIVAGRYSVEEQRLTIRDPSGEPVVMNIEAMSTEALRLGMPKAGSLDLKPVSQLEDPEHLLLGVWVTVHTMEGLLNRGYYYFRSDGTETFTVPFRTDQCLYAITGDRIRMTYPRQALWKARCAGREMYWCCRGAAEKQSLSGSDKRESLRLYRCGGRRSPSSNVFSLSLGG
jgi:hypothetical protein